MNDFNSIYLFIYLYHKKPLGWLCKTEIILEGNSYVYISIIFYIFLAYFLQFICNISVFLATSRLPHILDETYQTLCICTCMR